LLSLLGLVACGGKPIVTPAVITGKNADVGKGLKSQRYELTLIDQPQKAKLIGGLVVGGGRDASVEQAKGIWLIIPVRLTNKADEVRVLARDVFVVKDAQDREFRVGRRPEHMEQVFSDERWGSNDNYLVGNPMAPDLTREGPLIYDVAEDSTGLRMTAEGAGESLNLGF